MFDIRGPLRIGIQIDDHLISACVIFLHIKRRFIIPRNNDLFIKFDLIYNTLVVDLEHSIFNSCNDRPDRFSRIFLIVRIGKEYQLDRPVGYRLTCFHIVMNSLCVKEIGLMAVFALAFLVSYARGPLAKWGRLAMPWVALGYVGIYTNSSLSIGQLSGIVLGYIPDFQEHTLWWIMVIGALGSVLILAKNIYCGQVCPFQHVQRGLNKISGINLAVRPGVQKSSRTVVGWMTWTALMLIFLSSHPTLGSYEPFSMMFSLTGAGIQWYILPLSLIGSFFVLNFWCRLFCPVGLVLNKTVRVRRSVFGRSKKRAAEPEDKGDLWRKES